MDIRLIRLLDIKMGVILCFLLTLYRKLKDIFHTHLSSENRISKILFIKLAEEGSTVLALEALKKAGKLVGKENLYFLVFKENSAILNIFEIIPPEHIIQINSENIFLFIISFLKAIFYIRREKIDCCVDMDFYRIQAIIAYLSGAKKRIGIHSFNSEGIWRGDLFTHKLIYNPYLHIKTFF